jgi:putative acetyltransferase
VTEPPAETDERAARPAADITIRAEQPGDVAAIAEVVEAAFGSPLEARLVDAIRTSPEFVPKLSLVAELGGRVVGHVMISGASLEDERGRRDIVMLSPLAVAPDLQRRGIGSALVGEVTARADRRGDPLVVLEGSPVFYGRLGFEPAAPLGIHITLPEWAPPEAAQVMRLRAYEPSLHGRVVYSPAFQSLIE